MSTLNALKVQIEGKAARNFVKQYGYAENTIFNVVRLCFDNVTGKVSSFSIKVKDHSGKEIVADFAGKEGRIMGFCEFE